MKLARVLTAAGPAVGVVGDGEIRLLSGVHDVAQLLGTAGGVADVAASRGFSGETVPEPDAVYLSPIATPPTFRDFYAFEQHVKAGRRWRGLDMDPLWYQMPVFYFSNPYAFVGCGEVAMAPGSRKYDFELEVAAVVGRDATDVSPDQAEELIAGFCILNDWSARDLQKREMQLSMGPVKGKDTATSLGPWFVTPDELTSYKTDTGYRLPMTCSVNGVRYTEAMWSDVHWSFAEMISYASRGTAVRAGDVIGSGTCGTGCINELAGTHGSDRFPFLSPGDIVVAEIEGLGRLVNQLRATPDPAPLREGTV